MDRTAFEAQFTATTAAARDLLIKQAGDTANATLATLTGGLSAPFTAQKGKKLEATGKTIGGGFLGAIPGALIGGALGGSAGVRAGAGIGSLIGGYKGYKSGVAPHTIGERITKARS